MPTHRIRDAWVRDRVVLCAWQVTESRSAAEAMAAAGFDAVALDLQHGAATMDGAAEIFQAVELAGSVALARVPWNDPAVVMRTLDVGARGVICPMVGSRAEAESFVRACRFPPEGIRSYGPVRGALGSGLQHVGRSNETVLTFAMIETADGFRNVDDIAATPGLDALFVGPADLSLALGIEAFADLQDGRLLEALDAVLAATRRHGLVAGVFAPSPALSAEMAERGFRFVCPVVDADLLARGAAAALAETRERLATADLG